MRTLLKRPLIFLVAIGLGVLGAVMLVKNRAPLEHSVTSLPSRYVDVITAEKLPFRARVTAYGNVEPAILLQSKAEVSGKISYVHPDLKRGNSIPADTVVVRIDPVDYEVTLRQTEADLAANRAALARLQEEEKTTRRSLQLAKKNLAVGESELKRLQELWEKRLVAKSNLDAEEQKYLQLQQQLAELQGQLNTYKSRRASIIAQIDRTEQQVKGQQTTLGRTEISIPFPARVGQVAVEKGEFVSVGTTLFEALDVNGIEINAQLPVVHMRALVNHLNGIVINAQQVTNARAILESLELTARVRLVGGMAQAIWDARVLRFSESIDPTRRTLGVVVGVEKPYEKIIPGQRPPLLKGMYTAVELFGPTREVLVIPRRAIHNGRVYVVDSEDRLAIRPVTIRFHQGDISVVHGGLNIGERVIITDLIPVIEGMPLAPEPATQASDELRRQALGDATS